MLNFQGTVYIRNGITYSLPLIGGSIFLVNPGSVLIINQQLFIFLNKDTETFIMIISIFVQVFIMIAGLYFCLYMINSGWFNINSDYTNNMWKLGFEFIYFTFSVTITYSGSDIEVVGVIPKIIQMAHVIFFYFYAGDLLLKIVKKRNEIK